MSVDQVVEEGTLLNNLPDLEEDDDVSLAGENIQEVRGGSDKEDKQPNKNIVTQGKNNESPEHYPKDSNSSSNSSGNITNDVGTRLVPRATTGDDTLQKRKCVLNISKISCTNLKNVEKMMFDKNDPYVVLRFGSQEVKTPTLDGAGDKALFDHLDYQLDVADLSALSTEKLLVCVKDKNKSADVEIGSCEFNLSDLLHQKGRTVDLTGDLYIIGDDSGGSSGTKHNQKKCGSISISIALSDVVDRTLQSTGVAASAPANAPSTADTAPTAGSGSGPCLIRISKISCTNLKNVEKMMFDKNDPYVVLRFGSQEIKTPALDGAGDKALFDHLDYRLDVADLSALSTEKLLVCVKDKNKSADVEIGSCEFNLADLLHQKGRTVDLTGDLYILGDDSGSSSGTTKHNQKKCGSISISIALSDVVDRTLQSTGVAASAPTNAPSTAATATTTAGSGSGPCLMRISKISCTNLKNVEKMMFDKNDPYVVLRFGSQEIKTPALDGAGDKALFDHLDYQLDVADVSLLGSERLFVCVMDKNRSADVEIGSCYLSVAGLVLRKDRIVELSGDLYPPSSSPASENGSRYGGSGGGGGGGSQKGNRKRGEIKISILFADAPNPPSGAYVSSPSTTTTTTTTTLTAGEKDVLCISKISCTNLKNVEKMMFDKNDPYVVLRFGSQEIKTPALDGAGDKALFDHLDYQLDVADVASLSSQTLAVCVKDKNKLADVEIGSCDLTLAGLLEQRLQALTLVAELHVSSKNKKEKNTKENKKTTGNIAITIRLAKVPVAGSDALSGGPQQRGKAVAATDVVYDGLINAIRMGKLEKVQEALREHVIDPDYKDADGVPLMNHAVYRGNAEIVSALIQYPISVNASDKRGVTSLILAIQHKASMSIVAALLQAGVNILHTDVMGLNAVVYAASSGRADIVEALITSNVHAAEAKSMQQQATSMKRTHQYDVYLAFRKDTADYTHAKHIKRLLREQGLTVYMMKPMFEKAVQGQQSLVTYDTTATSSANTGDTNYEAIINCKVFVPLLTRLSINNSDFDCYNFSKLDQSSPLDELFLHLRLALELEKVGLISAIVPLLFGDEDKAVTMPVGAPTVDDDDDGASAAAALLQVGSSTRRTVEVIPPRFRRIFEEDQPVTYSDPTNSNAVATTAMGSTLVTFGSPSSVARATSAADPPVSGSNNASSADGAVMIGTAKSKTKTKASGSRLINTNTSSVIPLVSAVVVRSVESEVRRVVEHLPKAAPMPPKVRLLATLTGSTAAESTKEERLEKPMTGTLSLHGVHTAVRGTDTDTGLVSDAGQLLEQQEERVVQEEDKEKKDEQRKETAESSAANDHKQDEKDTEASAVVIVSTAAAAASVDIDQGPTIDDTSAAVVVDGKNSYKAGAKNQNDNPQQEDLDDAPGADEGTDKADSSNAQVALPTNSVPSTDISAAVAATVVLSGLLRISKISCTNLKNVEKMMFDKNDPYVVLRFGSQEIKTPALDGAGDKALFDHLDYRLDVADVSLLGSERLFVCVKDKNKSADVEIGSCEFNLADLLQPTGNVLELSSCIYSPSSSSAEVSSGNGVPIRGIKSGDITVTMQLLVTSKNSAGASNTGTTTAVAAAASTAASTGTTSPHEPLDSSFRCGAATINKIIVHGVSDKHPYLKLHLGVAHKTKTPKLERKGGKEGLPAAFENIAFNIEPLTLETIRSVGLEVEVWNDDWGPDTMTSNGTLSLVPALYEGKVGTEVEIRVSLSSAANKGSTKSNSSNGSSSSSYALVYVTVQATKEKVPIALPPTFSSGVLHINWINARKLHNKEWIGKQFSATQSPILHNVGDSATWNQLKVHCPLSKQQLLHSTMNFTLLDHNTMRGDVVIGSGNVELQYIAQRVHSSTGTEQQEESQVRFVIYDKDKRDQVNGEVTLGCCVLACEAHDGNDVSSAADAKNSRSSGSWTRDGSKKRDSSSKALNLYCYQPGVGIDVVNQDHYFHHRTSPPPVPLTAAAAAADAKTATTVATVTAATGTSVATAAVSKRHRLSGWRTAAPRTVNAVLTALLAASNLVLVEGQVDMALKKASSKVSTEVKYYKQQQAAMERRKQKRNMDAKMSGFGASNQKKNKNTNVNGGAEDDDDDNEEAGAETYRVGMKPQFGIDLTTHEGKSNYIAMQKTLLKAKDVEIMTLSAEVESLTAENDKLKHQHEEYVNNVQQGTELGTLRAQLENANAEIFRLKKLKKA